MRIVVLVKEVPDTYGDRVLDLETGFADRDASEPVLDEIGERALEVALSFADKNPGTEVVALSMSPDGAATTVRKALAMGAASAVHVVDEALAGADLGLTAEVISAALRHIGFDLVIAGNQSTDGSGGVLPSWVAELLEVPAATGCSAVQITGSGVTATRGTDDAVMTVDMELPAVISITEAFSEARFPNFKGIMAAKKKPFTTLSLADLGVDAADSGVARSIVIGVSKEPPREAGMKIVDQGDAGEQLAQFLIENRLA